MVREDTENSNNWNYDMKQKSILPYLTKFFSLMLLVLLPAIATAQSPWQWQMNLRVEEVGDAMYMPSAVAFDEKSERYYVVDTGRNRLVSFGRDGKVIRAFSANDQLKNPFDMIRLDTGQLWVVEKGRNSLTLIDIAAKKIEPHILKDGDRQVFPDRLAVSRGKIYVLDRANGQVLRLDKDLSVEQRFGCPDCSAGLFDFVIDGESILAIEPRDKKIYRFQPDGKVTQEITLGPDWNNNFVTRTKRSNIIHAFRFNGEVCVTFIVLSKKRDLRIACDIDVLGTD